MERTHDQLTEAEEMYNTTYEDLQKTRQLCEMLEERGRDMDAYFSMLENAEETLGDAHENLELAQTKYANEYSVKRILQRMLHIPMRSKRT